MTGTTHGDHVNHIHREHNHEADHMANLGAESRRGNREKYQDMESDTRIMGRHQRTGEQWMRYRDQSSRQEKLDQTR